MSEETVIGAEEEEIGPTVEMDSSKVSSKFKLISNNVGFVGDGGLINMSLKMSHCLLNT